MLKKNKERKAKIDRLVPILRFILQNPEWLKLPHNLTAPEIYALKEIGMWPLPESLPPHH